MIDGESEKSEVSDPSASKQPAQGSFLKLLPPQLEASRGTRSLPPRS